MEKSNMGEEQLYSRNMTNINSKKYPVLQRETYGVSVTFVVTERQYPAHN